MEDSVRTLALSVHLHAHSTCRAAWPKTCAQWKTRYALWLFLSISTHIQHAGRPGQKHVPNGRLGTHSGSFCPSPRTFNMQGGLAKNMCPMEDSVRTLALSVHLHAHSTCRAAWRPAEKRVPWKTQHTLWQCADRELPRLPLSELNLLHVPRGGFVHNEAE